MKPEIVWFDESGPFTREDFDRVQVLWLRRQKMIDNDKFNNMAKDFMRSMQEQVDAAAGPVPQTTATNPTTFDPKALEDIINRLKGLLPVNGIRRINYSPIDERKLRAFLDGAGIAYSDPQHFNLMAIEIWPSVSLPMGTVAMVMNDGRIMLFDISKDEPK